MNDTTDPNATAETPAPRSRRPRWGRRILFSLLGLVAVGLILVALAPTLAGTGMGRAFIERQISRQIDGVARIDAASFAWFGGQKLGGIKVYDRNQSLILEIDRVETDLSLAGALRGNLALGETRIDINLTRLQVDPHGRTNYQALLREVEPPPDAAPRPPRDPADRLPDLSGRFTLHYRGTIEYVDRIGGSPLSPPLRLDDGEAVILVADINSAIENTIKLALRLGERPAGSVNLAGKIDAIENHRLNLDKLSSDQNLRLDSIDLAALTPLVKLAGLEGTLGGVLNGRLALVADGPASARADGEITIADFAADGFPQLDGDAFRTSRVVMPIRISRTGVNDTTTLIKIESLRVEMPEALIAIAGEMTEQSLRNVAAGRPPGADGWLHNTVAVRDLTVANRLRRALRLNEGVEVTGGIFSQTADLTLRRDKVFAKAKLDAQVQGARDGQPIAIDPISTTLDITYRPATDPLAGLSDLSAVLSSGFASIEGGGETLDKLDFTGDFDLGKLRAQAAQFVDLGETDLRGAGTFVLGTRGDLQQPDSDIAANARFDLRDIDVRLPGQPPILIGVLALRADSVLRTDANAGIGRVSTARINLTSGDSPDERVMELAAALSNVDPASGAVERFEVSNLAITSLPRLVRQFGAFVPALAENQVQITDGQFYANVAGGYDAASRTVTLTRPLEISTPNLTVNVAGRPVLTRERITARAGGKVNLARGITAELTDLAVNSTLATVNKADGPLALAIAESGAVTGAGKLNLTADLNRLSTVVQAIAPGEAPPPASVTSGQFAGAVELRGGVGRDSSITLDGQVRSLTVASAGQTPVKDETLNIKSTALVSADLGTLTADAHITSGFVEAHLLGGKLNLSTPQRTVGFYEMLDALNLDAAVRDLPKLQTILLAFTPPDPAPKPGASAPDASTASDPLRLTSGGATLKASIVRVPGSGTLKVDVPDLRVSRLALQRGENRYAFDREQPISMRLSAEADTAPDALRGLRVTHLTGDLRVAQLTMPTPVRIDLSGDRPSASGAVKLVGNLADAQGLLAVFEAIPAGTTLAGAFNLDAGVSTTGALVTATLTGAIDRFQIRQPDQPALEPQRLTINGQARLDTASNLLSVDRLALKLPENDALAIDLSGGAVNLNDLLVQLDGTKLQYAYDLEKLWPMTLPLLDPETQETLADTKIRGKLSRSIELGGNYAANRPFHEAIVGVTGAGAFEVELIDSQGMVINSLAIPFALERGVLRITQTQTATANGGTLNLNGLTIDLTDPLAPRISGPRKQRLLHNVSINPALGNTLGKYVNPSFPNSDRAQGLLDVTIDRLDRVALGSALFTEDSGTARIVFSITDMDIANPLGDLMLGRIAGALRLGGGRAQPTTFRGEIRDAVITLDRGRTTQQLTMQLTEDVRTTDPVTGAEITIPKNMPMSFSGDIRLSDLSQRLAVSLPPALVGRFINVSERDMLRIFPDGVPISLRGTTTRPEVDLGNLAQRFVEGQIRGRLLDDAGDRGNPLEDLIRGLGGPRRDRRDQRDNERR